jgi:alcohol dehydrogenase (cytochrome c)
MEAVMKKLWLLVVLVLLWPRAGSAQTTDELVNDGRNPANVTTQSMGYYRQSFSPLKQITRSNVQRLVPVWNASLMNDMGELAAPTIYNGVMYVINGRWTFAIDVETGRQIWRAPVVLEPGVQRAAITRGAATIYNGKLFRVTIDNHVLALDMKTGKPVWNQKFADAKEGYYSTSAPIVANGVLISGMAGGESTTRGFLDGWDPDTGKKLWRRYTIPRPVNPARTRGHREPTRGSSVEDRRGGRAPTILRSISSTGAWAMPSPTTRDLAARWIVCTPPACSPSDRRPARSSATFNTRRTTSTTWTATTSRCSPISR